MEHRLTLLPIHLQQTIQQGQAVMLGNPIYQLPPFYRQNIYQAIGPKDDPAAKKVRGWLALLAARYVFEVWQAAWPENHLASRLIPAAESVLSRDTSEEDAREQAEAAWNELEELGRKYPGQGYSNALAAGLAVVEALFEAIGTHPFINAPMTWLAENDTDDSALDPWCTDAAQWAADA